jgi:septum formation protein
MRLVRASSSPRRADLLKTAGIPFEIRPVEVDERFLAGEKPEQAVARLARAKAEAAGRSEPDAVVLGADTTVVVQGVALGKPADATDAARMLRLLSGRSHNVLTGICLSSGGRRLVHVEDTRVRVSRLSDAEIAWYVSTGEPFDKAGAYAVQGLASRFIEGIDGSYANVVGLPVELVCRLIAAAGEDLLDTR